MQVVDQILSRVLGLQVNLYACEARLEAGTDPEALHDLRITVRRLRSLLHPLRTHEAFLLIRNAAAAVGQLTTPVRDLEVLANELDRRGAIEAAAVRRASLRSLYLKILGSPELDRLFMGLDLWPSDFRSAERDGDFADIEVKISRQLKKQVKKLEAALHSKAHDPHKLRLLTKRLRYCAEAYPGLSPVTPNSFQLLRVVQSSLGDWHDRYQWCLRANEEVDLQGLVPEWQQESEYLLADVELTCARLSALIRAH
jgi:CHAD domain-containing protein